MGMPHHKIGFDYIRLHYQSSVRVFTPCHWR